MKKIFFIIMLATAAFAGCTKQETDIPAAEDVKYNAAITADIPQTKVAIDDAYTKLSWNNGDRISVLTSNGVFKDFVYSGADGATSAKFEGTLETGEEVAGYAIYPAHADHAKAADGSLSVYLPAEHAWKESEVKGPMIATISGGTASFAHAGGLFAFDVTGMPAGAKGFRFEAEGLSINGSFAYGTDKKLKAVEGENTSVVMTFDALTEAQQMRFHIPVPTGSYEGFTISYINAEGMSVEIKSATATNVIDAATVKCFTVGVAEGDAWYVTATGTASADGLSWANATTLSNALAKAQNGDVIFVGAGTYVPDTFISGQVADADGNVTADEVITATGDAQKAFIVNKNVTILGGFPAEGGNTADPETNATVLSGNDVTNHVVLVSVAEQGDGKVKMSGFTVSGAASDADDSGKWSINGTLLDDYSGSMAVVGTGTTLDLENMTFTGNNTVNASAIYCSDATVNIKNCDFTENVGTGMGGCMYLKNSILAFKDCLISGNKGSNNGLIYIVDNNNVTFDSCTIQSNTLANGKGGSAIYAYTSTTGTSYTINILNSTIASNKSGGKGTVWCRGDNGNGTLNVVNCTFYNNIANNVGSAINMYKNITANIISNTIVGNVSDYTKDATRAGAICLEAAPLTVNSYNNIIAGNTRLYDNATEDIKVKAGTITNKYSFVDTEYYGTDGTTATVTSAFDYATMLGALNTDGVCPLLLPDTNPAVTGGMTSTELSALASTNVPAAVLTKDQLGNDRTGKVIGAYVGGLTE